MDETSWREVQVNDECWVHNGKYLGKCTQKDSQSGNGNIANAIPFLRFEETGNQSFDGFELKFTKVPCKYAHWREVNVNHECWEHDGKYLGRCIKKGTLTSGLNFLKFEKFPRKFFNGLELKYKKVHCKDTTGGRKYKKSIKEKIFKKHSKKTFKKNKYTKSKKVQVYTLGEIKCNAKRHFISPRVRYL